MEDKYATGLFRAVGFSLYVMHDEMAPANPNIFAYMVGKVSGLMVKYLAGGVKQFKAVDSREVVVFIDERDVYDGELDILNVDNIAFIKYVEYYGGKPSVPHALSIYTKKGDDLIDRRPKLTDIKMVQVPGYSSQKEFYSPDYSQTNTGLGTDARTTLLWSPYILTDAANRKIPVTFYNNDLTKRIRIVLEGINEEGKMIHFEKIIE